MKILIHLLLMLLFAVTGFANELSFRNVHQGDKLPQFCGALPDGKSYCAEQLNGRVAIILFFRSHQKVSLKQLEILQQLHAKYGSRGVTIIAISEGTKSTNNLQEFREQQKVTFPIIVDEGKKIHGIFGVFAWPSTGLFSRNGDLKSYCGSNWVTYRNQVEGFIRYELQEINRVAYDKLHQGISVEQGAMGNHPPGFRLAMILMKKGDYNKARQAAEASIKMNPGHVESHLLLARIAVLENDCPLALSHFNNTLKLDATNVTAQKEREICLK